MGNRGGLPGVNPMRLFKTVLVPQEDLDALRRVATAVPMEKLLVETDSPYLAPVPYRGRTNQPGYVKHVAEEIARLKGLDFDWVCKETTENFYQLFNILK